MIKVLLITGSYPPMRCGIGDYTAGLAQALRDSGKAQVAVLTGEHQGEAPQGIELIRLGGWSPRFVFRALRAAYRWRNDVVHMQFPTQGYRSHWLPWLLPLLLRMVGIRAVQTWHEFMPMGRRSLPLLLAPGAVVVVRPKYLESCARWCRRLLSKRRIAFVATAPSIPRSRLSERERTRLHAELARGQERVVTYFGFAYPHKGLEALFEIGDPARDHLVLACDLSESDPYHRAILAKCGEPRWRGRVTVAGFLPVDRLADVLCTSDAVALPFTVGAGEWNTSLHAVAMQGVFLVTTSTSSRTYDAERNIQYCAPGDVKGMRAALNSRIGHRIEPSMNPEREWARIADAHLRIYEKFMFENSSPA